MRLVHGRPARVSLLAPHRRRPVMWSTDFPHNESTYGYSNQSLASSSTPSAPAAAAIAGGNVKRFLGLEG